MQDSPAVSEGHSGLAKAPARNCHFSSVMTACAVCSPSGFRAWDTADRRQSPRWARSPGSLLPRRALHGVSCPHPQCPAAPPHCPVFPFPLYGECMWVALVGEVMTRRLCLALCAHRPKSSLLPSPSRTRYPLPPALLPAGSAHTVVCVCACSFVAFGFISR